MNARQCDFLRSTLVGVSLKTADLAGEAVPARLTKCTMRETSFDNAALQSARLDETTVCTQTVRSLVGAGFPQMLASRLLTIVE